MWRESQSHESCSRIDFQWDWYWWYFGIAGEIWLVLKCKFQFVLPESFVPLPSFGGDLGDWVIDRSVVLNDLICSRHCQVYSFLGVI